MMLASEVAKELRSILDGKDFSPSENSLSFVESYNETVYELMDASDPDLHAEALDSLKGILELYFELKTEYHRMRRKFSDYAKALERQHVDPVPTYEPAVDQPVDHGDLYD